MGDSFVHLHVHTEYSMLDGAARLGDLLTEASGMGMPALAMTDHGNLYGAHDFYTQAQAAGVKPIIGMEGYLAPGSRFDRRKITLGSGPSGEDNPTLMYTHMTLLAENTTGMHNLFRLSSLASLEGHYYKPRMDRELLGTYHEGVIATTGCPSGEINRLLQQDKFEEACQAAADYRDLFGRQNYFCELMDHGLDIERRHREDLVRLAERLGLRYLATNDLHYTYASDAEAHEVLLCVQTGKTLADPNRFRFDARDFYLKSPEEMRRLWREFPSASDNTLEIAERCDVAFHEGADLVPRFPVPEGESEESWLVKEVERGLQWRYPQGVPDRQRAQAEYEVEVVCQKGYPGYFLVIADLVRHAKENGIRVGPGRGSAAGAVIAYALGVTELDPLEHGLLFERFLNPERESMPDIDLDFDERRRGDMIRYTTERYGEERVAQIITYGTIKAKAAIKDAARVLGHPFATSDRISKAMPPPIMGKEISLGGIFDPEHPRYPEAAEFRTLCETDSEVNRVVDTARGLEGLKRQWGVHAAGVILSREPLLDVIPIQRREQDGAIITQFDMGSCEKLGLLKMDFLGLRNLTVLDDALANVAANHGRELELEKVALDNGPAYELLARGDTLGVFQLDGGPMRSLLRLMRPERFTDISAVLALYRPGPMGANSHINYAERKNGRQQIHPIHPELAEPLADILDPTYGLIVFQEQVMAIAQKVAGYTLGKADLLRRAMGKKKKEVLDKEFVPFSEGMRADGYSDDAVRMLWDILVPFSDYAFNRAHTAGYGLVSYWTAYLKANYPAEYMAALLSSVRDDKDKSAVYLAECRRMRINVLPPDVNESDADFTPRGSDIRFGLSAVRNVGDNVVASVSSTREAKGRFTDFADFLRKVEPVVCNKRVIESLAKAGAFDSLGVTRRALTERHEQAIERIVGVKRKEAEGQFDLFGSAYDGGDDRTDLGLDLDLSAEEWDKSTLLAFEREMLGLYVSDHPLFGLEDALARCSDCTVGTLTDESRADGETLTVGGILASLTRKVTKQGSPWAIGSLEDLEGSIDVMFFPNTYQLYAPLLAEDHILLVRGKLDRREDVPKLIAAEVRQPDLTAAATDGPVHVTMPVSRCTPALVERLKEVLATHPGSTEVRLRLQNGPRTTVVRLDNRLRVAASSALMGELKQLLGPACIGNGHPQALR